jgi:hypothetical protein
VASPDPPYDMIERFAFGSSPQDVLNCARRHLPVLTTIRAVIGDG